MTQAIRKLLLTTHVVSSVGWLGAVAAFLALAVAGLASHDDQLVRAAYVAMLPITWFVIVPLGFAALITGVVQALGTPWGLFRHYWVLIKLLLTLVATLLLLVHTRPIGHMAAMAQRTASLGAGLGKLQIQLVVDAGAALLLLLVTTTLSVYKPSGLTSYGYRKQHAQPE